MTEKLFNVLVGFVTFMTFAGAIGDCYGLIFIYNLDANLVSKVFALTILGLGLIANLFICIDIIICYSEIKEKMVF